jgi:hypothetical protein
MLQNEQEVEEVSQTLDKDYSHTVLHQPLHAVHHCYDDLDIRHF